MSENTIRIEFKLSGYPLRDSDKIKIVGSVGQLAQVTSVVNDRGTLRVALNTKNLSGGKRTGLPGATLRTIERIVKHKSDAYIMESMAVSGD